MFRPFYLDKHLIKVLVFCNPGLCYGSYMGKRSLHALCTKSENTRAGSRLVLISSVSSFLKVCSHSINMDPAAAPALEWREQTVQALLGPQRLLTWMIWPRPGCREASACRAPAHTPVQLIITSTPPLATWQQEQIRDRKGQGLCCALSPPSSSFIHHSCLLPGELE